MKFKKLLLILLLACPLVAEANPIITSWYTKQSGVYARVIQSSAITTPKTMWPDAGVTNNNTG